jgi:DNA phosphorothioation-associated putative methyltransferase
MQRYSCSRPIALAIADGLISKETSVFDYGCGRGGDIQYLRKQKVAAEGWDPHYRPDAPLQSAKIVNLGFVINVIENPSERNQALRKAFELSEDVLIASVRVDQVPEGSIEFADGHLTAKGTFQKIFGQTEFREYVEETLGRRAHMASLGVAYVFKNEDREAQFIANRTFTRRLEYRTDLIEGFAKNPAARRFVKLGTKLGRLPSPSEFRDYPKLIELFGSEHRIERLFLRQIDRTAFDGSRAERREDLQTYIASLYLEGVKPPRLGFLPEDLQRDIRAFWGNYAAACEDGRKFLFSLGRPECVRAACQSCPVGKLLPTDLYFHRSVEDRLPPLLRLVMAAARRIVGEVEYDVAKIALDGRGLSVMSYPEFDTDPHPPLKHSVRVYLPRAAYGIRDYSDSANPPILHRKETFVAPDYPHYMEFRQLTEAEDKADLLSQTNIGFLESWNQVLKLRGYTVTGHTLQRLEPAQTYDDT